MKFFKLYLRDQIVLWHCVSNRWKLFLCVQVELEATTEDSGTTLRAPTSEAGLAPACKDTCFGLLRLQMWERKYDGSKGKVHYFLCFRFFLWLVGWVLGMILRMSHGKLTNDKLGCEKVSLTFSILTLAK